MNFKIYTSTFILFIIAHISFSQDMKDWLGMSKSTLKETVINKGVETFKIDSKEVLIFNIHKSTYKILLKENKVNVIILQVGEGYSIDLKSNCIGRCNMIKENIIEHGYHIKPKPSYVSTNTEDEGVYEIGGVNSADIAFSGKIMTHKENNRYFPLIILKSND